LRQKLPPLAVLENVWGIRRHLNRVHRALHSLKWYEVITVGIDPYEMGEPVRRRRCWFLLVRVDVARARAGDLDDHARALLPLGRRTEHAQPSERLLTNDCQYIQEFLKKRGRATNITAASRGGLYPAASRGGGQLWRSQCALHPCTKLSQIVQGLSERQTTLLGILLAREGVSKLSAKTNVDLALSLLFATFTPYLPTITPNGDVLVGELHRLVSPVEKCLLNAFPVHSARWPPGFRDQDFADCGGNTMHLMAVSRGINIPQSTGASLSTQRVPHHHSLPRRRRM
jgi:hypothetical protein